MNRKKNIANVPARKRTFAVDGASAGGKKIIAAEAASGNALHARKILRRPKWVRMRSDQAATNGSAELIVAALGEQRD